MFRKKTAKETYDKENQKPIIRSSICTGEKVAGFKDIHTGKFTEVILIKNDNDMSGYAGETVCMQPITKKHCPPEGAVILLSKMSKYIP